MSTTTDTNWRLLGQCLDVDPDVMHPDPRDHNGNGQSKAICRGCPVATECFTDAIRMRDWNGTRGGMTGDERKAWAEANIPGSVVRRKRVAA